MYAGPSNQEYDRRKYTDTETSRQNYAPGISQRKVIDAETWQRRINWLTDVEIALKAAV